MGTHLLYLGLLIVSCIDSFVNFKLQVAQRDKTAVPSVQETVRRIIRGEVRFKILFLHWILSITRLLLDRFVFSKLFFTSSG